MYSIKVLTEYDPIKLQEQLDELCEKGYTLYSVIPLAYQLCITLVKADVHKDTFTYQTCSASTPIAWPICCRDCGRTPDPCVCHPVDESS